MAAKVFISYRREDSAAYAGRIQDRLEREFGRDLLFIDVDGIPVGINFVKVLREEVAKCGVLLAVIGPDWLDVCGDDGVRRLDNLTDFVRVEIATALKREIPVIPILLDNARVPRADQLPEDLKELALRNGLNVRHASFHTDIDKLIRELKGQVSAAQPKTMEAPGPAAATAVQPQPQTFPPNRRKPRAVIMTMAGLLLAAAGFVIWASTTPDAITRGRTLNTLSVTPTGSTSIAIDGIWKGVSNNNRLLTDRRRRED
jgi:TIR domain